MSAHTPGPLTADAMRIRRADRKIIASTNYCAVFLSLEERRANARLYAAAPGLLEAAEAAVNRFDGFGECCDGDGPDEAPTHEHNCAVGRLLVAIAKARGGA